MEEQISNFDECDEGIANDTLNNGIDTHVEAGNVEVPQENVLSETAEKSKKPKKKETKKAHKKAKEKEKKKKEKAKEKAKKEKAKAKEKAKKVKSKKKKKK